MTVFQDLHKLPEDERISLIGHYVLEHGLKTAVLVDDEPAKVQRYIKKLLAVSPRLVIEQGVGPVAGVVTLRISVSAEASSGGAS